MDDHNSASTELVERIAKDIQAGTFAPGSWLKQVELQRKYQASRPMIRLALDRLSQKRIIQHAQNRGYYVHEGDGDEVMELLDLRAMIECAAAHRIVANATEKHCDTLYALARDFDEKTETGSILEQYEANLIFHRELLSLSGNLQLVTLIEDLRHRIPSAPAGQWQTRARVKQSSAEHFQMVDAVSRRDANDLADVMRKHILQTK